MITLAWYLLKVIICSGILCGYYFLALRNKVFHRWNRFYLLAAIVISLIAPVMKINIFQNKSDEGTVIQVLQTISYGDEAVIEYSKSNGFQINTQNLTESAYLLVSIIFLTIFFISLYKIKRLKKKFPATRIDKISFINTNAKGTPFSFFKNIFWNKAIDLHSKSGQQIFNHEIAHIKEKHSYDKIFINLVLIFFWINPFFWLMRKELYMIHEFVADQEALEDSDVNALAEMILQTVYPGQNFSISNNFFYSPIKRRIMMLSKNKNPKVSYYSRLLVLPLAAIVFFAFTLKVNSSQSINSYDGKTITVVIDAGHGGDDNGAHSANGLKEKDITLSIAKKIAVLNSNEHINILLSRDNDQTISVRDRVHFAKKHDAGLFVSIHVNGAVDEQLNGFSVLIDRNNTVKNQLIASAIIDELKETYKTENQIEISNRGLFVVDSNACPAALIECGYLSNLNDVAFITNSANQEKIAKDVLSAINNYASSINENKQKSEVSISDFIPNSSLENDTIPEMYYKGKKIKNVQVQSKSGKIKVINQDGTSELITKEEANKNHIVSPPPPPPGLPSSYFNSDALFVINDKISTNKKAKQLDPNSIESINVLKDKEAINKYGDKGKKGVIEITTKFNIAENPLIIIDGKESSKQELNKIPGSKIKSITILKKEPAMVKYGDKAKDGSIEIITKKNVTISSAKDTVPDKIFTKVETEASFPGGLQAWTKYISKAIRDSIDKFSNRDYGTCVIRFIVNVDGKVSDVVATTMEGTELAKVSVNAVKHGPKWIPASQNGRPVAAYRLQPVTLQQPNNVKPLKTEIDNGKVFIKAEQPASFPGGQSAWLKYISKVITQNGNELTANRENQGTCNVRFIVDKDGMVNDVQATTMKGTKLAEVAMNAIKEGPNWVPGKQNGHFVNSFVIQPVTFSLSDKMIKNEPQ
jgi:N-acetylmuramoyl-L-alanine amidase